jgi:hypothetical protein
VRGLVIATAMVSCLAACSYGARFDDCEVRCSGGACPSGLTCGTDGFCHTTGSTDTCSPLPPDGGGDPLCSPCQVVDQCGCPGGACDLQTGAPACRPAGAGVEGTPCDELDDCAAGFSCLGNAQSRACHRFCADDGDCQGRGGLCDLTITGQAQKICSTDCNPLSSTGCPPAFACHVSLNPNTDRTFTNCHRAGTGVEFQNCAVLEDCAAGLVCVQFAVPRCYRACLMGAGGCGNGTTCRRVGDGQFIGGDEYGICL